MFPGFHLLIFLTAMFFLWRAFGRKKRKHTSEPQGGEKPKARPPEKQLKKHSPLKQEALTDEAWERTRRQALLAQRHAMWTQHREHSSNQEPPLELAGTDPVKKQRPQKTREFFEAVHISPFDELKHVPEWDIDGARRTLQKIAYTVHAEGRPEKVAAFSRLMKLFAWVDPLFWDNLKPLFPVIQASPGIRQTKLYEHMPTDVETARYVLYFAEASGFIKRVKRGNSYMVYLPEQSILEIPPPKATRKRTSNKHGVKK
ncbi:MAG: hypothetical protein Q4A28_06295 [Brachymonas sp.]|nr:hypothetical protein [Brachymonas sp.]